MTIMYFVLLRIYVTYAKKRHVNLSISLIRAQTTFVAQIHDAGRDMPIEHVFSVLI